MITFGNSDHLGSHKITSKKVLVLTKVDSRDTPWIVTLDGQLVQKCRSWEEVRLLFRDVALYNPGFTWYIKRQ